MSQTKKEELEKTYTCFHWGKYLLKSVAFSLESAHQLLVTLQGKRSDNSVKAKLNAYPSSLKLIRKGKFGNSNHKIPFTAIQRFFVFKTEPHLIFLGVEEKKRLSYVVMLFRDIKDVNEVCDLIERKKGGTFQETDVIQKPEETAQETEPNVYVCYERSVEQIPESNLITHQTQSEPMEQQIIYIPKEEVFEAPIVKKKIEYHYNETQNDDLSSTSMDNILERTNMDNVNSKQWIEDMKYLKYNPMKGTATESEFGPIYMYTAHFNASDNNTFESCESDEDSWNGQSINSMSSIDNQGVITKKNVRTTILEHNPSNAGMYL